MTMINHNATLILTAANCHKELAFLDGKPLETADNNGTMSFPFSACPFWDQAEEINEKQCANVRDGKAFAYTSKIKSATAKRILQEIADAPEKALIKGYTVACDGVLAAICAGDKYEMLNIYRALYVLNQKHACHAMEYVITGGTIDNDKREITLSITCQKDIDRLLTLSFADYVKRMLTVFGDQMTLKISKGKLAACTMNFFKGIKHAKDYYTYIIPKPKKAVNQKIVLDNIIANYAKIDDLDLLAKALKELKIRIGGLKAAIEED